MKKLCAAALIEFILTTMPTFADRAARVDVAKGLYAITLAYKTCSQHAQISAHRNKVAHDGYWRMVDKDSDAATEARMIVDRIDTDDHDHFCSIMIDVAGK